MAHQCIAKRTPIDCRQLTLLNLRHSNRQSHVLDSENIGSSGRQGYPTCDRLLSPPLPPTDSIPHWSQPSPLQRLLRSIASRCHSDASTPLSVDVCAMVARDVAPGG